MQYVFLLHSPGDAPSGRKSFVEVGFIPIMVLIGLLAIAALIIGVLFGPATIVFVGYLLASMIWVVYLAYAFVGFLLVYALIVVLRATVFKRSPVKPSADFLVIDKAGLQHRVHRVVQQMRWESIQEVIWRPGRISIIDVDGKLVHLDAVAPGDFEANAFAAFCQECISAHR